MSGPHDVPTHDAWSDASSWAGGQYRRESFFFSSGGEQLYGSLYAATTPKRSLGLVVCPSWGMEGWELLGWCHNLAHGVAGLGGYGLVLHWPGFQDSEGDPRDATFTRLTQAVHDAVVAGRRVLPGARWSVAGIRIGAAVAALAAPSLSAPHLLLVQPELDPVTYFDGIERAGRRFYLGEGLPAGWAFGHPLPSGLRMPEAAGQVAQALGSFAGTGAVVRYKEPASPAPPGLESVTVRGDWRRPPMHDHRPLLMTAIRWVRRTTRRAA